MPRFAEVAVERARLSVVPRLRSKAPRIPFVTLVSVILLAGVVGLLLFNTSMQQASFTASRLEDQAADLSARQQELAMDLDGLRDPTNLATAGCQLGMVVAPTVAFIDLATGRRTGTATPAVATPGPCIERKAAFKAPTAPPAEIAADIPPGTTGANGAPSPTTGTGTAAGTGTGTAAGTGAAQPNGTNGTTRTGAPQGRTLRPVR